MSFELVEHEQGSQAWLRWRSLGIGASDAPTIMGENPWKTAGELQQEKLAPRTESVENPAMARGSSLEPIARGYYCDRRKFPVAPACIQSTAHSWMRASLDGINVEIARAVEIKCGESTYRSVNRTRTVPSYYYGQLQHILAVAGFESIDFWCFSPDKRPILIEVQRNEWYITKLIETELEFWTLIAHDVQRAVVQTFDGEN